MLSKMTDRAHSPVAPASLGHTWGAVPPLPRPPQDSAEGTGNSC